MTTRAAFLCLGGLVSVLVAAPVRATKPCPPPVCRDDAGAIDAARCKALSDWVAIGTIGAVVHHEEPYPLLKDFAEFSFTITTPEKGPVEVGQVLRFRVGWCENSRPPPENTSGLFRFFGLLSSDPTQPRFLDFERAGP